MAEAYRMKMNELWSRRQAEEDVESTEDLGVEKEQEEEDHQEEEGVISAIIATRKDIMRRIATNHPRDESPEVKMVGASFVMRKDIRK